MGAKKEKKNIRFTHWRFTRMGHDKVSSWILLFRFLLVKRIKIYLPKEKVIKLANEKWNKDCLNFEHYLTKYNERNNTKEIINQKKNL